MRRLWVVLVVAMIAVAFGCGESKEATQEDNAAKGGDQNGAQVAAGTPEAAANEFLTAMKKGDFDAFFDCVDLKGVYDMIPEDQREGRSFEEWDQKNRKDAKDSVSGQEPPQFDYEILGSEVRGDVTVVKIEFKDPQGGEGEQVDFLFKKIGDKWKMTAEGFIDVMGSI